MKRPASECEADLPRHYDSGRTKRRKNMHTRPRAFSSPPFSLPSQTAPLTTEILQSINSSNYYDTFRYRLEHWLEDSTAGTEEMAAPPTPQTTSQSDRARRHAKLRMRSSGSRTPSPTKKPTPQTYRIENLHYGRVFIDRLDDLPSLVDDEVRGVLGIQTWDDQIATGIDEKHPFTAHLNVCTTYYLAQSRANARECALEGDWRGSLHAFLKQLSLLWPGQLKSNVNEKVWHNSLKPSFSALDESAPDESLSGDSTKASTPSIPVAADAFTFTMPIPSLPPPTQSADFTTSTQAANPYYISTPKPDISVGIAHSAFMHRHQLMLSNHQASGDILSDPHSAAIGLRFPFLVVEAKGLSSNGSLVSAQNQAAVSGASMLTILKDLDGMTPNVEVATNPGNDVQDPHLEVTTNPGRDVQDPKPTPLHNSAPRICFSIVTEGPVHELWVHFEHEDAVHMYCIQSWRTTRERDTREFVLYLFRIMQWGAGKYKEELMAKVNRLV